MVESTPPAATDPGQGSVPPPGNPAAGGKSVRPGRNVAVVATHNQPPSNRFPLPFLRDPDGALAASFRILAHRLRGLEASRTLCVSSPGRSEGKSVCATNLAMALAEHGRDQVLLVEANLRQPRLGEALGFAPPACFAAQMVTHLDQPDEPWQVVAAFFDNLHVLAVDPAKKAGRRLNAPAFRAAIDQLKQAPYAHIIIDCPGALGSADVNIIEDTSDGVIFTAMSGVTKGGDLLRAKQHLDPGNVLGSVLMGGRI